MDKTTTHDMYEHIIREFLNQDSSYDDIERIQLILLALLVIPASAARLACRRLGSMMVFSPVFGGTCSIVGLYLSWAFNLPTGGTIVLSMVAAFVLVWAVTAVRSRARAQLKN